MNLPLLSLITLSFFSHITVGRGLPSDIQETTTGVVEFRMTSMDDAESCIFAGTEEKFKLERNKTSKNQLNDLFTLNSYSCLKILSERVTIYS